MVDILQHLRDDGYSLVDIRGTGALSDSAAVLSGWFEHCSEQQKLVQTSGSAAQATCGRGYFRMPAKEVLEVKQHWRCPSAPAELRLAANTACATLCKAAYATLQNICSSPTILSDAQQLQQELLVGKAPSSQQPGDDLERSSSRSSDNSVLHINRYTPTPAAAAACSRGSMLQGDEAHVDKGLLTVIWATQPGLQVLSRDGSWVPITPGPHQLVILVGHTLSFLTAGRLPAAMHRVVVLDSSEEAQQTEQSARLSFCFKLRAAPDAVLSPATMKPASAGPVASRYQVSKTVKQLMDEFDASHTSLHAQRSAVQQPQRLSPPAAPAAVVPVKREPTSSPDHPAKRPCQQRGPSSVHSMNQQLPQSHQQDDIIWLICKNQAGRDVSFKVRLNMMLARLFSAYAREVKLPPEDLRYGFDGARLEGCYTPRYYGMKDGDIIDVYLEQLGD